MNPTAMNPRSVINFFKTPAGAFLAFCVILGVIFFAVKRFLPGATKPAPLVYSTKAAAADASKQTMQTFQNTNFSAVKNLPTPDMSAATAPTGIPSETTAKRGSAMAPAKPEILPISLFAETPTTAEQKPLSKNYAPFGRLISCELIVTVDSSSMQTPIVGLVTDDVYFGGRLLIPAGTEIHGRAQTDRTRERIASSGGWTFVWQDGRELRVSGIALDREFDPDGTGWGITDGSAGLRGRVLKTDDMAEIKLFAASFLSGAASAFTQNQQTVLGTQVLPTAQNAGLEGAQTVIQAYAQQIYDSIQRDGFYVRVAAGKQFYLYITQTLDVSDAAIGGTRFAPDEFAETNSTAPNARNYFSPNAAASYQTSRNGAIP
ncbi:MAG: TrbI/VirB10 family protein [Limisphaerales bacterium]